MQAWWAEKRLPSQWSVRPDRTPLAVWSHSQPPDGRSCSPKPAQERRRCSRLTAEPVNTETELRERSVCLRSAETAQTHVQLQLRLRETLVIRTIHQEHHAVDRRKVVLPHSPSCRRKTTHLQDSFNFFFVFHRTVGEYSDWNSRSDAEGTVLTLYMTSQVKRSEGHSCDGQLLGRWEKHSQRESFISQRCSVLIAVTESYWGVMWAHVVLICRLWACEEESSSQRYPAQGKPAFQTSYTNLQEHKHKMYVYIQCHAPSCFVF